MHRMKVNAPACKGTFRVVEFKNPSGVIVHRVTGWTLDGRRISENIKEHGEAVTRLRELQIQGANLEDSARPVITRLTAEQAVIAERAFAELKDKSMLTAIRYFLDNYREPLHQILLSEAVAKFIAHKETLNLRPSTLKNLRVRLEQFKIVCGEKTISEITTDDCRDYVFKPDTTPRSRVNARLVLSNFFGWATDNKYVQTSPLITVKAPATEHDEPRILSLSEVRKLLAATAAYKNGKLLPYVTLGLFAGIRPAELARISWDDVCLTGKARVTISGKAAKMRARRVVDLSANAVQWLKPFALARAPFVSPNHQCEYAAVRTLAGFDVPNSTPDILRHTAVTMHLEKWQHEGRTASWAGNSPDIIQRHYRGLATKADATTFWKIAPDPVKAAKRRKAA